MDQLPLPQQPVPDFLKECGITKPTFLRYIKRLSIQTVQQGRTSYLAFADAEKVTALACVIKDDRTVTLDEAVRQLRYRGIVIPKLPEEMEPDGQDAEGEALKPTRKNKALTSDVENEWALAPIERWEGFWLAARKVLKPLFMDVADLWKPPSPEKDLLKAYEYLERAHRERLVLNSSLVSEILKMKLPSQDFKRLGYRFIKVDKSGHERLWRVLKIEYEIDLPEPDVGM